MDKNEEIVEKINNYIKKNSLIIGEQDKNSIITLLETQHVVCSKILKELKDNKEKISHWAWYIFPTENAGRNDPLNTYVTEKTAEILLELAPPEWKLCLEKIIELAHKKDKKLDKVLPVRDIDRVFYFIEFWEKITFKPHWLWLSNVCVQLRILYHIYHENKYNIKEKSRREQEHIAQEAKLKKLILQYEKEAKLKREKKEQEKLKEHEKIKSSTIIKEIRKIKETLKKLEEKSKELESIEEEQISNNNIDLLEEKINNHFTKLKKLI